MSAAELPKARAEALLEVWRAAWEPALEAWSKFTKLQDPRWCLAVEDEKRERLSSSFAMIRLDDHAVVISLRQIEQEGLQEFGKEILAHEIGHHVYAPGDLRDNARLIARIRRALPTREGYAGLVGNLYTDLLINDRLQRGAGLDLAGVFKKLKKPGGDALWTLYQRIYENLWKLPRTTLVDAEDDPRVRTDADLGARVVRAYAKDWLGGAGRFAALLFPYIRDLPQQQGARGQWLDTEGCGAGDEIPDGLSEIDEDEETGALHPSEDPALTGLSEEVSSAEHPGKSGGAETHGGRKNRYRDPAAYVQLMASLGVKATAKDLVMRYYRERAVPHLIPFPVKLRRQAADPLPEGLDVWDVGSPISQVDWSGTLANSPLVIPGVTTLERTYGTTEGSDPERVPLDLYVGIDCSGSMLNPAVGLSFPVLAGAVVTLSALRAKAKVMACLSGEPGRHAQTNGFVRTEREVLSVMTDYLGTGYAFGILRLKETFLDGEPMPRPTHILIVSDSDFFYMLKEVKTGWEIARQAAERARGGATAVLQIDVRACQDDVDRLEQLGWKVHPVSDMSQVVAFAREFARARYGMLEEGAA
ncbi:MAG TPA: hypothetical protein VGK67_22775 [Myxococcales bacterium]